MWSLYANTIPCLEKQVPGLTMQHSLFHPTGNILPFDGEAYFFPQFFSNEEADEYLDLLANDIAWKQEPIKIFGKEIMQPRLTAYHGDADRPYSYSGITMHPAQWNAPLLAIKQRVEKIAKVNFTAALLNQYRDGSDSMGWHRDNEKVLGVNPVIASVSFGAARNFTLRNYADKKISRSLELTHGSLLLMQGSTQHFWEHQVAKTRHATGMRINITFRVIP